MAWIKRIAWVVIAIAAAALAAGQAGLLRGRAPPDLGVRDGRLKAPSQTPNSVSSQAALWPATPGSLYARIDPLPVRGGGPSTLDRIQSIVQSMPGTRVIDRRPDYLDVEFGTRWLGFVDDAEFWFDPQADVIHVRSASRLGRRDFGVNRARIEAIRERLAAAP